MNDATGIGPVVCSRGQRRYEDSRLLSLTVIASPSVFAKGVDHFRPVDDIDDDHLAPEHRASAGFEVMRFLSIHLAVCRSRLLILSDRLGL